MEERGNTGKKRSSNRLHTIQQTQHTELPSSRTKELAGRFERAHMEAHAHAKAPQVARTTETSKAHDALHLFVHLRPASSHVRRRHNNLHAEVLRQRYFAK
eukprot:6151991-Pleurochrysis_carterae.AAC.1